MKESTAINNKRILIVEDEPAISKVCQRVLYRQGFKSDVALNGQIAKNMMGRKRYELYLIDVKMPVMNGKELYQWLQGKDNKMADKVIFMTGSVFGEETRAFLEKTGRLCLLKPFTTEELATAIKKTYRKQEIV